MSGGLAENANARRISTVWHEAWLSWNCQHRDLAIKWSAARPMKVLCYQAPPNDWALMADLSQLRYIKRDRVVLAACNIYEYEYTLYWIQSKILNFRSSVFVSLLFCSCIVFVVIVKIFAELCPAIILVQSSSRNIRERIQFQIEIRSSQFWILTACFEHSSAIRSSISGTQNFFLVLLFFVLSYIKIFLLVDFSSL
jgi:hypothetical protein